MEKLISPENDLSEVSKKDMQLLYWIEQYISKDMDWEIREHFFENNIETNPRMLEYYKIFKDERDMYSKSWIVVPMYDKQNYELIIERNQWYVDKQTSKNNVVEKLALPEWKSEEISESLHPVSIENKTNMIMRLKKYLISLLKKNDKK